MFLGTTPAFLRPWVAREMREWNPRRVIVPFAGNFAIEGIAQLACPEAEVISTDVSLYSRALGFFFVDAEFDACLNEKGLELFPYFRGRNTPRDKAIQALFLADAAESMRKAEKVRYYRSLANHLKAEVEQYAERIGAKLDRFRDALPKKLVFYGTDAVPLLGSVGPDDFVYYDPPFWSDGYEKMFADMEKLWDFVPPTYTEFTDELKLSLLSHLRDRAKVTYWRTLNPLDPTPEGFHEVYRYEYKPRLSCCVYSSRLRPPAVGFNPALNEKVVNYKVLTEEHEIGPKSRIDVVRCPNAVANHYRMMWVKGVEMTDGGSTWLFFVDGLLFGVCGIISGMQFSSDLALINTDPTTPTSRYRRLSKLLISLICSKPFLAEVNDLTMWEHTGYTTAVFTNRDESMKYRGLFELAERKKNKAGTSKWVLYYHSKDLFPTYRSALAQWLQKDGRVLYAKGIGASDEPQAD